MKRLLPLFFILFASIGYADVSTRNTPVDVNIRSSEVTSSDPFPVSIVEDAFAFPFYQEGDTDSSIQGVEILWEGLSNTVSTVSGTSPLPVLPLRHPLGWDINENYSSAQTAHALVAAPGSGLSLYITDITISNGATAGTIKLIEDTGGAATTKYGPINVGVNGGGIATLKTPIKLTANKNLGITSATVTTHTIFVSGYTAP